MLECDNEPKWHRQQIIGNLLSERSHLIYSYSLLKQQPNFETGHITYLFLILGLLLVNLDSQNHANLLIYLSCISANLPSESMSTLAVWKFTKSTDAHSTCCGDKKNVPKLPTLQLWWTPVLVLNQLLPEKIAEQIEIGVSTQFHYRHHKKKNCCCTTGNTSFWWNAIFYWSPFGYNFKSVLILFLSETGFFSQAGCSGPLSQQQRHIIVHNFESALILYHS